MSDLKYKNRIESITHLRAVVMHFDAAIQLYGEEMDFVDLCRVRKLRDYTRVLITHLEEMIDGYS